MVPFRLRVLLLLVLSFALTACPTAQRPTPPQPTEVSPAEVPVRSFPGATLYQVVGQESLVRILVYRGGKLASAGHNHVVSSHDVHGNVYLHKEADKSGFDLVVPVNLLEVDNKDLRSEEGPQFAAEVPENAKQGTRKNMLGDALLDGEHYPGIALSSISISGSKEAMQAHTRITVKGQPHEIDVPIALAVEGDRLTGTGELDLRQSDLGLKPFSILGGALTVQDQMKIKFRIVADKKK